MLCYVVLCYVSADDDECTANVFSCQRGRCINSYGGYYCLNEDSISNVLSLCLLSLICFRPQQADAAGSVTFLLPA